MGESAHAIKQYVCNKIIHRILTRLASQNLWVYSTLPIALLLLV